MKEPLLAPAVETPSLAPEAPAAKILPDIKRKTRKKTKDVLVMKKHAEHAKEEQIAMYGQEQWHKDFEFLEGLERVAGTKLHGEELRRRVLGKMRAHMLRQFQECFSSPEEIVYPRLEIRKNDRIFFKKYELLFSSVGAIADPSLIPVNLLVKTKMIEPIEKGQSQDEILEMVTAVIPRFKKMLDASVPIYQGNDRIRVVANSTAKIDALYPPEVPGPDEELLGKIIYIHENVSRANYNPQDKKIGRPLKKSIMSVYDDVHSAIRMTRHQGTHYSSREFPQLAQLLNAATNLIARLDEEWTKVASSDAKTQLAKDADEVISDCEKQLKDAEHPLKKEVNELLAEVRDCLAKKRSTPAMTKLVASFNRLEERSKGVMNISEKNDNNRNGLIIVRQRYKDAFIKAREQIFSAAKHLESITGRQTLSEGDSGKILRLCKFAKPKGVPDVEPFLTYVHALQEYWSDLHENLKNKDIEHASESILSMRVIAKLQAADTCVELLKDVSMDSSKSSVPEMRKYLDRIVSLLNERDIMPDRELEKFKDVYAAIQTDVHILKLIIDTIRPDMDVETYDALIERFNNELDRFDIRGKVKQLVDFKHEMAKPR